MPDAPSHNVPHASAAGNTAAAATAGAAAEAELDEFRCAAPAQVRALLCELRDTAGPVVLSSPDGSALRASLWTVDTEMQRVSFDVEPSHPALPALVGSNECTAVAYLQSVKLQFDLDHLMLVRGPRGTALQAALPRQMFRFQRRQAFRVRTPEQPAAIARLRHPAIPDMRLSLRVMDISANGCALQLPPDVPPLSMGIVLEGVVLALDAETQLQVTLRLQHATSVGSQAEGVRLGCELVAPSPDTSRALQRYVDQLQRRRRLLAMD